MPGNSTNKRNDGIEGGDGFYNTLKTLKKFGGSLIVREYAPADKCYINKCITIRFDGQDQFIIESYRADKIKALRGKTAADIRHTDLKIDKDPQTFKYLNIAIDKIKQEIASETATDETSA